MKVYCGDYLVREIEEADFHDIHDFASKEEICGYQAWGPNSEEDTRNYIKNAISKRSVFPRMDYDLAIYSLKDLRVIGTCGLYLKDNDISEIGFTLSGSTWGRGIGTAIAQTLIELSFRDFDIGTIIATCDILNERSNALL